MATQSAVVQRLKAARKVAMAPDGADAKGMSATPREGGEEPKEFSRVKRKSLQGSADWRKVRASWRPPPDRSHAAPPCA